jgi:hypothetical protein
MNTGIEFIQKEFIYLISKTSLSFICIYEVKKRLNQQNQNYKSSKNIFSAKVIRLEYQILRFFTIMQFETKKIYLF